MHRIATSTFTITGWDEEPWDDQGGAKLSRARVTKTFEGELAGTSVAELLLATTELATSRAYVGFERIVGDLNGRLGSFVLHHTATTSGAGHAVSWSVVPDSGTGDLWTLRGEAQIVVTPDGGHTFTMDYDLET